MVQPLSKLGMKTEMLRSWVRQAEVDQGREPGLTADKRKCLTDLERAKRDLKRANEFFQDASIFFALM
jgi:transposase